MRTKHCLTLAILATALPVILAGAALGGEGIEVRITNDGTADLVVTVYDLNTRPQRLVLENARINGFTSVPVNVVGDATGRARLAWTATSTDSTSRSCGHADAVALGNTDALSVHADSSCDT